MTFPAGSPANLHNVLQHRHDLAFTASGRSPIDLLCLSLFANASEPHDKIFGLLGLLPPVLSHKIHPRYTVSAQEVYRETIIAFIECSGSLDFLIFCGSTWIPDLSVSRAYLRYIGRYCSSESPVEVTHVVPDLLMATGVTFDAVEAVLGPLPQDDDGILEMIRQVWLEGTTCNDLYATGETLAEACAWALAGGRLSDRWPDTQNVRTTMTEAQLPFEKLQDGGDSRPWTGAPLTKVNIAPGSTFFRTTKGYFGWSVQEVSPRDKVCVLLGCSLATILREKPNGQHIFVGCAYVHGIMDGEALVGPLPDGWKVVIGYDRNGNFQRRFTNPTTDEGTLLDPRLPPLSPEWEHVTTPDRLWPNKKAAAFYNTVTRQILRHDPRMYPDALRARDVPLERFALV